jgi:hypothetical protein
MKPIAMTAFLLFCPALVPAQQNPTYIYMYDASAAEATTSHYYDNIDGVTVSWVQSSADACGSTACTPSTYTWPDGSGVFGAWVASTVKGGANLSDAAAPCTVNINFKSVANNGKNTWAPQYIFTQSWANYAAQQNQWQPNHVYPLGSTMTCTTGNTGCPNTITRYYYYQVTAVAVSAATASGLCLSASAAPTAGWPAGTGGFVTDGNCTWTNETTLAGAPLQDVVLGSATL